MADQDKDNEIRMGDTAPRDVASAVKARRVQTKPRARTSHEVEQAPEPALSTADLGVVSTSVGAPTLTGSFVAGMTASADYIIAPDDGYESFYPRGAAQPTCIKLWSRGQQVHKAYFVEHGGTSAASSPTEAKPVNAPGGGIHDAAGLSTAIK